jgi:hypothetical protein
VLQASVSKVKGSLKSGRASRGGWDMTCFSCWNALFWSSVHW